MTLQQLTNSHKYDDIIGLPHPISVKHPQMAREDRAAQFSPFAALTGYDEAISETQRLTETKKELDEDVKTRLNEKIAVLATRIAEHPVVKITYLKGDGRREGGAYLTIVGAVRKVKEFEKILQMEDGTEIPLADVSGIEGEIYRSEGMSGS